MPDTIVLRDIRKVYRTAGAPPTEALRGIDLTIPEGDFVAIMGPSGSGKSSLMHIVGLLDRRFEGTYLLDGHDAGRLSANRQADLRGAKIGFVFQQFNLLPRASVLENVLLPTTYRPGKADRTRALDVIERVGLSTHAAHKSNQLSGGQMQRVAIARALIMGPSLLLADEPTGNLDTKTAGEIMDLFAAINGSGTTVVLITHENDIAARAHRTIRLRDGVIAREEAP
jgi:putative ABC transport system ATP-binding protein